MKQHRYLCSTALWCATVFLTAALFSGCSYLSEIWLDANPTAAPTATIPFSSPTASPEPTATPFCLNPLQSFYQGYLSDIDAGLSALLSALAKQNSAAAQTLALAVSTHQAALSSIGCTICRLYGDDADGYSATLFDAAAGVGTMQAAGEGYSFSFSYEDGSLLAGNYLLAGRCEFVKYDSQGNPLLCCAIEKTAENWASAVQTKDRQSELLSGSALSFTFNGIQASLFQDNLTISDAEQPLLSLPAPTEQSDVTEAGSAAE